MRCEVMEEIISKLEQKFVLHEDHWLSEPFQVLVATILSQNTSDINSQRAFLKLKEILDVRPEVLASSKPKDIKSAIMCAGLSNIKSQRIIDVSKEILTRFNGDLGRVFQLPLNEARTSLMDIKGIGPKTADVFLSFVGHYPIMPVDTNIFRVVNRLGFAERRNYERTRRSLEKLIPPEKLMDMHIYLIRLGREICKPRKPLCPECPINKLCDYGINLLKRREF